jgi:hypothetical protein
MPATPGLAGTFSKFRDSVNGDNGRTEVDAVFFWCAEV